MEQEQLADRIKRLREAAGMSHAELALEARLVSGRQQVYTWESGGQPGSRFIPQLADALEVSSHYLLTGHESRFVAGSAATGAVPQPSVDTACG